MSENEFYGSLDRAPDSGPGTAPYGLNLQPNVLLPYGTTSAPDIYYRDGRHRDVYPGPKFPNYLDGTLAPLAGSPSLVPPRTSPQRPHRDYDQELADLYSQRDRQSASADGIQMPEVPSGHGRLGHEAIAAGLAILGNLLDRHHEAGLAGYKAFRSGLSAAQSTNYQNAVQRAQAEQQKAAERIGQTDHQIERVLQDRQQSSWRQELPNVGGNQPSAQDWSIPTKLGVSYDPSQEGAGPSALELASRKMAHVLDAAVADNVVTRSDADGIAASTAYLDPQFFTGAAAAYVKLLSQKPGPVKGGVVTPSMDALAQLWRMHYATLSRLKGVPKEVIHTERGPNEQLQFNGATAQLEVIGRHLLKEAQTAGFLHGPPESHAKFWHSPTGVVVARIDALRHFGDTEELHQRARMIFTRLTGLKPDF